MSKVNVKSTISGHLTVFVPAIPFQHEWLAKDSSFAVEMDTLEQLMYDNGFKYMIDTGMLYIEDLEIKKALGIEPEDVEEPVKIIVLTDKERRQYMINLSMEDFKEKTDKLNFEQVSQLADYAIANRLADFDKAKYLKEICGRDVIQAIRLSDQNKEV